MYRVQKSVGMVRGKIGERRRWRKEGREGRGFFGKRGLDGEVFVAVWHESRLFVRKHSGFFVIALCHLER